MRRTDDVTAVAAADFATDEAPEQRLRDCNEYKTC